MKGEGKLGEMVGYIVWRCGCRRNFGRAMLCRLCYFADFDSYELRGASVSGSGYVLGNAGPEPAEIDILLDTMSRRKDIRIAFIRGSETITSRSAPDLSLLTPDEVGFIDRTIDLYAGKSERILSWMSREDAPCTGRRPSDPIDYASVRLRGGTAPQKGRA